MPDFRPRLGAPTWLVLVALWVLAHPYGGLRHDGLLYAGQAMAHLRPDVFGRDLFFAYGSQDDYTIFGQVYAAAVKIGEVTLDVPFGVAPMAGMTDTAFRRLVKRQGG